VIVLKMCHSVLLAPTYSGLSSLELKSRERARKRRAGHAACRVKPWEAGKGERGGKGGGGEGGSGDIEAIIRRRREPESHVHCNL